jgi:hypothetical protein
MAVITKSIAAEHRLVANLIPVDVLKMLDQSELLDRLVYAQELTQRSRSASDITVRKGYAKLAQAMLRAQPRSQTERQSATLIAKAAAAPNSQADALRRKAQELLEQHPPAPRRGESAAVMKAKAAGGGDDLFVCFDQAGNVIGVCQRSDIQPVSTGTPSADVAKAARSGKATQRRPVRR